MAEDYVTKSDLTEALANFAEMIIGRVSEFERNIIAQMEENFVTKQELAATEERLVEKIHDTKTRMLRGYESHARAVEAHLKALDGQSAANFLAQAGLAERMSALEARMLNLELLRRPPQ